MATFGQISWSSLSHLQETSNNVGVKTYTVDPEVRKVCEAMCRHLLERILEVGISSLYGCAEGSFDYHFYVVCITRHEFRGVFISL
jgi:hypothetical protein